MGSKRKSSSSHVDKNSSEYREKRQKNNSAVKRSRDKTKQKNVEASERISKLSEAIEDLRTKNQNMSEALGYLKDILLGQTVSTERLTARTEAQLTEIVQENAAVDLEKLRGIIKDLSPR